MNLRRRLYEAGSFLKNLPSYYRFHVRRRSHKFTKIPANAIFIDRDQYILPPMTSSLTFAVWEQVVFTGHKEDELFKQLRTGCTKFLDLGCAEGYFSAFFAITAKDASEINAIDLSPALIKYHKEVIESNSKLVQVPLKWTAHQIAISATPSESTLRDAFGDYYVNCLDNNPDRPIKIMTLVDFLNSIHNTPDLIKLDIESYEYEVLTSSIDWLATHKPRIHLELHSKLIKNRGKSPHHLLDLLQKHYRIIGSSARTIKNSEICHIGLLPI